MKTTPYIISLFADENGLREYYGRRTLAKTIIGAANLARGVANVWVGIRLAGRLVAEIETDWRGQLFTVHVHSPISSRVSAINPQWSKFEKGSAL